MDSFRPRISDGLSLLMVQALLLICTFAPVRLQAQGQGNGVSLEVQALPALVNGKEVNYNRLFSKQVSRQPYYRFQLQFGDLLSTTGELYLNIRFVSQRNGILAELHQVEGQPIISGDRKVLRLSSDLLDRTMGGMNEPVVFDGGMTPEGELLLHENAGTRLPPGRYTIEVQLYQAHNALNGGELLAAASDAFQIGFSGTANVLYLTRPGEPVGTKMEILNPYPEFRWEGEMGVPYRLVVVRSNRQESPESLIQGALGTQSFEGRGTRGRSGTVLDYEVLDARVKTTAYQFPPSGVQALEPGETYYWQVFLEETPGSTGILRSSEIWEFTLAGEAGTVKGGKEMEVVLRRLLGEQRYRELQRDGFQLLSVEIDGETYMGSEALNRLSELKTRMDRNRVSFSDDTN